MRWYLIDNFDENNHFVKQLNGLGQLEPIKFSKGIKIRPLSRAKKQIRSLVNIVLSNDPRWTIYPRPTDDLADPAAEEQFNQTAMRMSQWFSDLWYFLDVKDRVRELVTYGFKYNVGYAEIGADEKGNIFIDTYEPYEIWHEPGIKSLKETSVLVKSVSRTLAYVKSATTGETETDPLTGEEKAKPLYKPECVAKLKPETRFSLAEWKNVRLREQSRGNPKEIADERIARVFLKEVWLRDGDHWDIITECQGQILREEHTEFTELPFVSYKPFEGLLYSTSPYEDLIPLNQAIDIQVAMLEAYVRTVAVARFLKQKNAKLSKILNENGEIIEYEGQTPPTWLQPAPTPVATVDYLNILKESMDEIGTSVVSFGKVPKGVKAAQALDQLKNIEYANNQTPIDLLAKTLEEMAEKVLDLADRYFKDPVTVYHMTDGKPDFFKIVSQESVAAANPQSEAIPVSSKYMVKVEIESDMAFSEEGKRQTMMELYDKGLVPPEEVLKSYKMSNVEEILNKTAAAKAQGVSIVQTPEFAALPAQLRIQILEALGVDTNQPPAA